MISSLMLALLSVVQVGSHHNVKNGLAVEGYDVVSYFIQDEPLEGARSITSNYEGATYRFASEENKAAFLQDPKRYIPQYGGWCAYAMGVNGDKVKVDPETYKIVDGDLYLFYNFWGNNTLKSWNEDEVSLKDQADKYWSDIIAPN